MSIVTAVIPCYNAGAYLAEAIASIKAQTVPVAEILVVDDGSTDDSMAVAEAAGARVLSTRGRKGAATARNIAARATASRYLAFLDADDQWLPAHCETLLELMNSSPQAAVAFSRIQNFGAEGDIPTLRRHRRSVDATLLELLVDNPIAQSAAMVDRQKLLEIGGYKETLRYAEDFDLWLRLAERFPLVGSDRVTCRYRIHPDQVSRDLLEMTRCGWEARLACRARLSSQGRLTDEHQRALLEAAADDMRSAWVLADRETFLFLLEIVGQIPGGESLQNAIRARILMLPLRRLTLAIADGINLRR